MSYLSGLKQLDPSVKRHNGGGSSFTLDEIGTTQATRLVVGGVEQVPNVDFTVSGATLSTTSATPSGTNNVVTFQYFKSGTVNTATAVSAGGVNNAAMADDAIGIAELSATGTASSSTFLRGDNAWAAPANPITLISETDISDAATYNFTAFDSSKNDSYEWVFHNVVPATDAASTRTVGSNTVDFLVKDSDASHTVHFQWQMPADFSSLTSLLVVNIADATETFQWDVESDYGLIDEAYNTNSESQANQTKSFVNETFETIDVSGVFSSVTALDICGVHISPDINTLHTVGLRCVYA